MITFSSVNKEEMLNTMQCHRIPLNEQIEFFWKKMLAFK